jgi:hypothetical protein
MEVAEMKVRRFRGSVPFGTCQLLIAVYDECLESCFRRTLQTF